MKHPKITDLKNKTVVITGGSGVLCSVMAEELARQGAKIAILNRNIENGRSLAAKLNQEGGTAIAIKTDVLNLNSLVEAKKRVNDELGSCDILINGAGGNHPKGTTSKSHFFENDLNEKNELTTFFDLDPEGMEFVFNLNFLGTFLPTKIFAKDMVGKKGCSVLNISSMSAYSPLTRIPAYSAAKAAVSNFTQWLAVHFSKVDIRVNAIAPGFFLTHQNRKLLLDEQGNFTERATSILEQTPMSRFGSPDELIGTVLWLCSDSSAFVTGVVVPVDGGFSAFSGV